MKRAKTLLKMSGKLSLTHSLIHVQHFETVPNSKKLQTTTEVWDFKIQIA